MTGRITRVGATDTKHFGILTAEDGTEYAFEEPFTHLDDRDRGFEVGHTVTFKTSARHPGLAYDVEVRL